LNKILIVNLLIMRRGKSLDVFFVVFIWIDLRVQDDLYDHTMMENIGERESYWNNSVHYNEKRKTGFNKKRKRGSNLRHICRNKTFDTFKIRISPSGVHATYMPWLQRSVCLMIGGYHLSVNKLREKWCYGSMLCRWLYQEIFEVMFS